MRAQECQEYVNSVLEADSLVVDLHGTVEPCRENNYIIS